VPRLPLAHPRAILFVYAALTGGLALAVAHLAPATQPDPLSYFPWIAIASIAVVGSLVALSGVWTATGAYAAVFWCFHFGLVAVLATGLVGVSDLSVWDFSWILGPYGTDAARLALAGALAFASGAALTLGIRRSTLTHVPPPPAMEPAHPYGNAGSMLVFAGIGVWGAIVLMTSGPRGFFASYFEYLAAAADYAPMLGVAWLAIGFGLVLAVTGKGGSLRTAATAAFAALTILVLPIGIRGEVMFRGVAALVAAARCGRRLSTAKAVGLAAALLVLIPFIREVRLTGVRGLPNAVVEARTYESLAEMGASLHPVEKVVRWRSEGDPWEGGSSYWAPIERAAARLLPGFESVAADQDLRITSVLVTDRVGAIGFSPVAEAYRNFGPTGVVIVMSLFGAVLAAIDTIRVRRTAVLTLAVVYVPLLVNVRNSFVAVPAHCAFGLSVILALALIRHVVRSVVPTPYARPAYVRTEV
jgi:hypothetical protein